MKIFSTILTEKYVIAKHECMSENGDFKRLVYVIIVTFIPIFYTKNDL